MHTQLLKFAHRTGLLESFPPVLRYLANAVNFNNSPYLTRGSGLTGAVDGKQATLSYWINPTTPSTTGVGYRVLASSSTVGGTTLQFRSNITNVNAAQFAATNAAGAVILSVTTGSSAVPTGGGWKNILISCDLNSSTTITIYVNDSLNTTVATYSNDTMVLATADVALASLCSGTQTSVFDIADVWFDDSYLDLTTTSNRRKFISADLKPVNLGNDGSVPTGAAPLLFLSGPTSTWQTNDGSGGGMTLTGTITTSTTTPSG